MSCRDLCSVLAAPPDNILAKYNDGRTVVAMKSEEFKLSKIFGDIVDHKKQNEFSISHENVVHS